MALVDTKPSNKTTWQRVEQAVLEATGGDVKLTAELTTDMYHLVLRERGL